MKKILPLALIGLVVYALIRASKNNDTPTVSPETKAMLTNLGRPGSTSYVANTSSGRSGATPVKYSAIENNQRFTMPANVGVGRIPNPIN